MGSEHDAEVRRRLIRIQQKTDAMDDSLTWLVRANADGLLAKLLEAFGSGEHRIAVYLALDGKRNVNEIAALCGMKPQNVTRELRWLKKKKLIRVRKTVKLGKRYIKEDFDEVVELSLHLEKKLRDIQGKKNGKKVKK
jgi:DNA-binding MarR family transcriptional regulator